jgi:hypothetical protein
MPEEVDVDKTVDNVKITTKMLKGLFFTGSSPKEVTTSEGTKTRHMPFERDLKPDDLLDARNNGDGTATVVTKDGKKYVVDMGK